MPDLNRADIARIIAIKADVPTAVTVLEALTIHMRPNRRPGGATIGSGANDYITQTDLKEIANELDLIEIRRNGG